MCRHVARIVLGVVAAATLVTAPSGARAAPYLGQEPPGPVPVVFAPGVVSTGNLHGRLAIAPDGREMYWTTVDTTAWTTRLLGTREIDGRWTDPAPPPFAADAEAGSPLFSPDGQRLYYAVRAGQRRETWFVERTAAGWSEPRRDSRPLDGSCSRPTARGSVTARICTSR